MSDVLVFRSGGDWVVQVDGRYVGTVHRARMRRLDRPHGETQAKGQGRWRWVASPGVNDEDFATRKEAVAELVRRRAAAVDG